MIAETLAEFSTTQTVPELPNSVMRLSLLDWCAVGIAGCHAPVSEIVRAQAIDEGGHPQASIIGTSTCVPARMAALVNGTISHALDYDDTHFAYIGHPSVAVVPAALAAAQLSGASVPALIAAAVIGAEASVRVGLWLGRSHYQAGFHQTATSGAFGASLAAARLLGLTKSQTVMALGLVATRASGLKAQFGTMGKPMNAGIAASNGIEAALLAKRGFISTAESLQAFWDTHHCSMSTDAWDGIGDTWLFPEVSHKFHACCHGLHAMLEALTPMVGGDASLITNVEVKTHPRWLTVCNIAAPQTGLEAKFSYRMTAAMRLLGYDTARPDSFADDLYKNAPLAEVRDKITVLPCDTLTEMQAQVSIYMQDGTTQRLSHDLNAPGDLDRRKQRILHKAEALLTRAQAEHLWDLINSDAGADALAKAVSE